MSQAFSGGCAYEFWNIVNGYGLVEMPDHSMSPFARLMARTKDESQVAERRETDGGPLIVYHDFLTHKARLASIRDAESIPDNVLVWPKVPQEESHSKHKSTGPGDQSPWSLNAAWIGNECGSLSKRDAVDSLEIQRTHCWTSYRNCDHN